MYARLANVRQECLLVSIPLMQRNFQSSICSLSWKLLHKWVINLWLAAFLLAKTSGYLSSQKEPVKPGTPPARSTLMLDR